MRASIFLLFFVFFHQTWSQEIAPNVQDSLSINIAIPPFEKDFIQVLPQPNKKGTLDSIQLLDKKKKLLPEKPKKPKKERHIPYIKSMKEITVEDYKIKSLDGTEKSVDTTLSIENEYSFNFLRKDYFEYLPLPNMGEGFNKMGYDFHDDPLTPQMGATVKHFGYFEKEDVFYYEVPSPYTELFFKSTFQQGQHLDATLAVNTSPKFNVAVSFKGFRSMGEYSSSLSRSRQFRMSTQYQTYNQRYRLRLHQTTQSLENDVNGGLINDAVYFFENAPNYLRADESGALVLDDNGEEQFDFYEGFLKRSLLSTQIRARNDLSGKRYFMDHRYQMLPLAKDTTAYKMEVGYQLDYETKQYNYIDDQPNTYFYEIYETPSVQDSTNYRTLENKLYARYKDKLLGELQLDLFHYNWNYALGENDYQKDSILPTRIKASQLAAQVKWTKTIFGTVLKAKGYQSLKYEYATTSLNLGVNLPLLKDIYASAKFQYRSQPLNFNYHLFQSDFKEYNWSNINLVNQNTSTKVLVVSHPKWGNISAVWSTIDNYGFFKNTTQLKDFNKKFKVEVQQLDKQIDYFKARFNQRLDFGKLSWINDLQYQKVTQGQDPDKIIGDILTLNVPEWLVRSTLMLTSSIFNNALSFQSGATFVFFTDYYADQYNPLLSEFVTQNNTKIGEYPRVDFFFNAKIQNSRIFIKLENVSAPIEHLINIDTPYDYYAAPFMPYRDFSIRFGLIWNFFQ
ncbi:MAG: hypothetical protein ACI9TK_000511 [Flavobacteriaceae bacterium]|jgi:hypothetical protein